MLQRGKSQDIILPKKNKKIKHNTNNNSKLFSSKNVPEDNLKKHTTVLFQKISERKNHLKENPQRKNIKIRIKNRKIIKIVIKPKNLNNKAFLPNSAYNDCNNNINYQL